MNTVVIVIAMIVAYLLGRSSLLAIDGKILFDDDGERFIITFPEGKEPARYRTLLLRVVDPESKR